MQIENGWGSDYSSMTGTSPITPPSCGSAATGKSGGLTAGSSCLAGVRTLIFCLQGWSYARLLSADPRGRNRLRAASFLEPFLVPVLTIALQHDARLRVTGRAFQPTTLALTGQIWAQSATTCNELLHRHSPPACVIRSKPFAGLWSRPLSMLKSASCAKTLRSP
jgi:hypothetical protein